MEIFVVLCTSAKGDEFAGQVEQLGQWLEFDGTLRRSTEGNEFSKNDTVTQLAAGKPEKWSFLDCGDVGRGTSTTPDSMQPQFHRLVILCTFVENIVASSSATDYVEWWRSQIG